MIHTLSPQEAELLIAKGGLDVVDVRGAAEYSSGHIPQARSVPLAELTADLRAALPHDGVVFVCAKGVRSLTAAKAAEAAGLVHLYSIDGGTQGWSTAGLPIIDGGSGI
jgi:rhodanese-related sulfurtransferase